VSNRPTHRIRYTDKATKTKYDVGVIFPPRSNISGLLGNLKPQAENEAGQWPKMALTEALERHANGEGYLDVWEAFQSAPKQGGGGASFGAHNSGDFSDDVPF